jgi:hypothetical protein
MIASKQVQLIFHHQRVISRFNQKREPQSSSFRVAFAPICLRYIGSVKGPRLQDQIVHDVDLVGFAEVWQAMR